MKDGTLYGSMCWRILMWLQVTLTITIGSDWTIVTDAAQHFMMVCTPHPWIHWATCAISLTHLIIRPHTEVNLICQSDGPYRFLIVRVCSNIFHRGENEGIYGVSVEFLMGLPICYSVYGQTRHPEPPPSIPHPMFYVEIWHPLSSTPTIHNAACSVVFSYN